MSEKFLIMMVGLPRSGKSTKAKEMGYPMVNPDSIRLALHSTKFCREAEPMVWAITRYMIKSLFIAGHDVVILDSTNITVKNRNTWIDEKWVRKFYTIETPAVECINRAISEDYHELISVITRMSTIFEPVSDDEYTSWEHEYHKR